MEFLADWARSGKVMRTICYSPNRPPVSQGRHASCRDGRLTCGTGNLTAWESRKRRPLEATAKGNTVTLDGLDHGPDVAFAVRKPEVVSEEVQLQVFQRSFSTKGQPGRGISTYSVKLFGEQYLGGKVGFVSRSHEGTTFTLKLPKKRA